MLQMFFSFFIYIYIYAPQSAILPKMDVVHVVETSSMFKRFSRTELFISRTTERGKIAKVKASQTRSKAAPLLFLVCYLSMQSVDFSPAFICEGIFSDKKKKSHLC